ncbi:sugar kinase [Flaviflexus equikiangi]|uniref:Sugar kinase n=1 Tax=Flaviflexus equikiangi TaxID=2758573 RepID=A0ABS2TJD8_9ACTO|nr:sugar kinase [Flaviflexus equikiangi]MBM9433646.1 sugar kinase [Flaviflexus equikiangi]
MKLDVVTLGEAMGTFRFSGPFGVGATVTPSMAGAETNVAIALARLGHATQWVGSLGRDTIGEGILKTLRGEGVGVDHVRLRPQPTGILISRPLGPETKRVDYHRSGSAGRIISDEQVAGALAEQPRILHISGITPALGESARSTVFDAVHRARELGIAVSFDINYRSRLWDEDDARSTVGALAKLATIVFGGSDELMLATGEKDPELAMTMLATHSVSDVVWKSSDGARALTADGYVECANRIVRAVDPIGAGDAFVAGYLSAWLEDLPREECLRRGHTLGAIIVGTEGDWEGLPTRRDIESMSGQPDTGGHVLR